MKKVLSIMFLLVVSITLISCKEEDKTKEDYSKSFTSMGSVLIDFKVFKEDENLLNAEEVFNAIKEVFTNMNELTDNFLSYGDKKNVKYINENPNKTIEIEKELYDILLLAIKMKEKTNGYFDVSIGKIIDLWKELLDSDLVTKEMYDETLKRALEIDVIEDGINLEVINNKHFVTIKENVKIDLGAIAKGYTLDLANNIVKEKGLKNYYLKASDSSAYYGMNNKREGYFNIALSSVPYTKETEKPYYQVIKIRDTFVTTSGDSIQRRKLADNEDIIIHHIISPITKKPENYNSMVTLVNDNAGVADALTTALMGMSNDIFYKFYKENDDLFLVFLDSKLEVSNYLPDEMIYK